MMHMAFHFNNPTNLIFGRGTRMELGRQKMQNKSLQHFPHPLMGDFFLPKGLTELAI